MPEEISTVFTFNMTRQIATFEYWVDTIPVSKWTLSDGNVTSGPMDEQALPMETAIASMGNTERFIASIKNWWNPSIFPVSEYEEEFEKDEVNVKTRLKINGVEYIRIVWNSSTDMIAIEARPIFDSTWADYMNFIKHWRKIHKMVADFKTEQGI